MKILLLGANGQLGRAFVEHGGLGARGELVTASRDGLRFDGVRIEGADLAQPAQLHTVLERVSPRLIVNAAAYTAVDRAERQEALATCVNGQAVGVLGAWAAAHGARVLHYSTDYVFDGHAKAPYPADAPTAPLGAYGRSKLAGEVALRASGAAHLILRTAWVYAPHGHNFLRTMLRLAAERDELRVVADQVGAPTSVELIVAGSLAALDTWLADAAAPSLTEHLVASGYTSWHGFAQAIIDEAHARSLIARKPAVVPIGTTDYPTPARRPAWSVLDNRGFSAKVGFLPADWREGLGRTLVQIAGHV